MTNAPILVLIFNRPVYTRKLFDRLRQIRPERLYIAADGPRPGHRDDASLCDSCRQIFEEIDWPCAVQRLIRTQNLGCRNGVRSAIDWFFENEVRGIILEDDCIPALSFPRFCSELLERYETDDAVMHISGTNFQFGTRRGDGDYYFSRYCNIWGWATWRRAWQQYDRDMTLYDRFQQDARLDELGMRDFIRSVYVDNINTWDAQWVMTVLNHRGKCITPQTNLVRNIGFDRKTATHTFSIPLWFPRLQYGEAPEPLRHPSTTVVDELADRYARDESILPVQKGLLSRWILKLRYKLIRKSFLHSIA